MSDSFNIPAPPRVDSLTDPRRLVHFRTDAIDPPAPLYLALDDQLTVDCWSSQSGFQMGLALRLLLPSGEIIPSVDFFSIASNRTQTSFKPKTPECFILGLVAGPNTVLKRGQLWARVAILRAGAQASPAFSQVLCSGYAVGLDQLTWPEGQKLSSTDGRGWFRSITGTQPGVGAEISETVPTGAIWRLISFKYTLTTSATVGNRDSHLIIDDGTNNLVEIPAASNTAASLAVRYTWGTPNQMNVSNNAQAMPMTNADIWLPAGCRIRTSTTNLAAGDQYSAPQYFVEEYIQP